jgi:amidase
VAGQLTTGGCRALAVHGLPASADAECLAGARTAQARIVGKANLHELAFGVTGVNPWFGTPVNPLDATLVPGGSSSGCAVAVAMGDADVAYGTDTGGSVRIPSACCGTAALKTSWGRVSTRGVLPLSPSLDTVGPMARDVDGLVAGMELLEPGFRVAGDSVTRVGRLRVDADPRIDDAIDAVLRATSWLVDGLDLPLWSEATRAGDTVLVAEAWHSDHHILEQWPSEIGTDVADRLRMGAAVDATALGRARQLAQRWKRCLDEAYQRVDLIVTPTLTIFPPRIDEGEVLLMGRCTLPVNVAGVPACAIPVPSRGPVPASLQLIGPAGSEERLLGAARTIEAAANSL